jgi:hypothetical protein
MRALSIVPPQRGALLRATAKPWLAILLVAPLAACGSSSPGPDAPLDCSKVTGVDQYVAGLEKTGESNMLDFKLLSAEPAPPMRDDNTWVVEISQMANNVVGAPMDGLSLNVTPYMPAHQHGTPIEVVITPGSPSSGQYTLAPVNLWMPGIWQTTIVASMGSVNDQAVYSFCIPD